MTAFRKSTIIVIQALAGTLVIMTIAEQLGAEIGSGGWVAGVVCPIVMAYATSLFAMRQQERLLRANFALEEAHRQLAEAHARLAESATKDPMTGLLNRISFFGALETERRKSQAGALLLVDADQFKSINDRFGHQAGDEALLLIADAIHGCVRGSDRVGRIGGEEFAVLLPDASAGEAREIAERIRRRVETIEFRPGGSPDLHRMSVSIGGASLAGGDDSDRMHAADLNLYAAKRQGRNRAVLDFSLTSAA